MIYPYFSVQRYPTDPGTVFAAAGGAGTMSTQNIQLQSIPRRIFIFARKKNADILYTDPDAYMSITGVSVNWNNHSGLLSSASQQDLYQMCVKNGVNLSWEEWSGGPSASLVGGSNLEFGLVGSVLCIEMGTDISLDPTEAPGQLGTYQLQIDVSVKNVNQTDTITPSLYILVISEGSFSILNNTALPQIGIISKKDVVDSKRAPKMDYNMMRDGYGGSFWSGFHDLARKFHHAVKQGVKYGKKGYEFGKKMTPHVKKAIELGRDVAPLIEELGPMLAAGRYKKRKYKKRAKKRVGRKRKVGRPKKRGGILIGGKKITRAQLRNLMM